MCIILVTLQSIFSWAMFLTDWTRVTLDRAEMLGLNVVGHCGVIRTLEATKATSPAAILLSHHVISYHFRQI